MHMNDDEGWFFESEDQLEGKPLQALWWLGRPHRDPHTLPYNMQGNPWITELAACLRCFLEHAFCVHLFSSGLLKGFLLSSLSSCLCSWHCFASHLQECWLHSAAASVGL